MIAYSVALRYRKPAKAGFAVQKRNVQCGDELMAQPAASLLSPARWVGDLLGPKPRLLDQRRLALAGGP
jgi:hypothetical protein